MNKLSRRSFLRSVGMAGAGVALAACAAPRPRPQLRTRKAATWR